MTIYSDFIGKVKLRPKIDAECEMRKAIMKLRKEIKEKYKNKNKKA